MQVARGISRQGDLAAIDEAAGAAEFGRSAQVVLLQEQEDVVLIDPDDPQVHRRKVDGPEREDEPGFVRKDVPFQGNLDGRQRVGSGEIRPEILTQGLSAGAFDAPVDEEGKVLRGTGLEEDPGAVVADVHRLPEGAGEFQEAFLGGRCGERFTEPHFHARIPFPEKTGVDHLEDAGGRNHYLERFHFGEPFDFQFYLDRFVGARARHPVRCEPVEPPFSGEGDRNGRIHRDGKVFLRDRNAEADRAFQADILPDVHAVQGEGGALRGCLDPEGEDLAVRFPDIGHFPHLERSFIDGPFPEGVGNEFHDGRTQPALRPLEGGLEGEQAGDLALHGHGSGQFDADGRSFRNDAARVGGNIGSEIRVRGFRIPGRTGCQEGEKDREGENLDSVHGNLLFRMYKVIKIKC